jgi:hypothetical protein
VSSFIADASLSAAREQISIYDFPHNLKSRADRILLKRSEFKSGEDGRAFFQRNVT